MSGIKHKTPADMQLPCNTNRDFWRSFALSLICLVIFYKIFVSGLDFGLDKILSFRYTEEAFPIALSHLVPGHPKDYTSYPEAGIIIKRRLISDSTLEGVVEEIGHIVQNRKNSSSSYTFQEDKGPADFVILAFKIFGFRIQSLYYMFFLALGVPLAVFISYYFQHPEKIATVLLFLLTLYTTLGVLAHWDRVNLAGIHEPRFFAVIAIIPLIHILMIMVDSQTRPFRVKTLLVVIFHTSIILFANHCRSDTIWQSICIFGSTPVMLFLVKKYSPINGKIILKLTWPILIVTMGWISLKTYNKATLNPVFFSQATPGHLFWHPMVNGFTAHPDLGKKYQFSLGELNVDKWVEIKTGRICLDDICNEREKSRIFFDILKTYPWKSIQTYIYFKPKYYIDEMGRMLHTLSKGQKYSPFRSGINNYYPLQPVILIALALTAIIVYRQYSYYFFGTSIITGLIMIFSFMPSMVLVPAVHIAAITLVTVPLFIYTLLLGALTRICLKTEQFFSAQFEAKNQKNAP